MACPCWFRTHFPHACTRARRGGLGVPHLTFRLCPIPNQHGRRVPHHLRANKALELTAFSVVERGGFSCVSCYFCQCYRRWRQLSWHVRRLLASCGTGGDWRHHVCALAVICASRVRVLVGSASSAVPVLVPRSLPLRVLRSSTWKARRPRPCSVHPLYAGSRLPVLVCLACGEQVTAADAGERGKNACYVQACLAWKACGILLERR